MKETGLTDECDGLCDSTREDFLDGVKKNE